MESKAFRAGFLICPKTCQELSLHNMCVGVGNEVFLGVCFYRLNTEF